jgi:hypothetical protein
MPTTYNPYFDQTRATSSLLKFCEDHGYKSDWLENVRRCLMALNGGNIMEACDQFRQVPFGGNGCFNDWTPPVVFAYETQEYVRSVFDALSANWTLLMNLYAKTPICQ